jgi:hypothetical protein
MASKKTTTAKPGTPTTRREVGSKAIRLDDLRTQADVRGGSGQAFVFGQTESRDLPKP